MKSKLQFFIATLLILVVAQAATPSTANACDCGTAPSLKEELDRADVVFSGTVIGVIEPNEQEEVWTSCERKAAVFHVTSIWKGKPPSQVVVFGSFPLAVGLRYLVYAWKDDESDQLYAINCGRTALLVSEHAQEDIAMMGMGTAPSEQGAVLRMPPTGQPADYLGYVLLAGALACAGMSSWLLSRQRN